MKSSYEPLDRKRAPRFAVFMLAGIAALTACSSNSPESTSESAPISASASPSTTPETPVVSSETATQSTESSNVSLENLSSYSVKDAEKLTGYNSKDALMYLSGVTDLLNPNSTYDYYSSADTSITPQQANIHDAMADELSIYVRGEAPAVQELLNKKQLSVNDVAYLYGVYEKMIPQLETSLESAKAVPTDPNVFDSTVVDIEGIYAKASAALIGLAKISELYTSGDLTLSESTTCDFDSSKDFVDSTFNLTAGDGFITVDPSVDPAQTTYYSMDRFNPFYSGLTSVANFGFITTERAKACGGAKTAAGNKMLLPYLVSASTSYNAMSFDQSLLNYPELVKIKKQVLVDIIGLNPADYESANTYKEK